MLFHPWYPTMMLAGEASNVIDLRLWKIARGGTDAADESRVAKGGSSAQVIDMYRRCVAENASMLQSGSPAS